MQYITHKGIFIGPNHGNKNKKKTFFLLPSFSPLKEEEEDIDTVLLLLRSSSNSGQTHTHGAIKRREEKEALSWTMDDGWENQHSRSLQPSADLVRFIYIRVRARPSYKKKEDQND